MYVTKEKSLRIKVSRITVKFANRTLELARIKQNGLSHSTACHFLCAVGRGQSARGHTPMARVW